jgi:hypothetical protein
MNTSPWAAYTSWEPSGDQEIELGLVTCASSATSEPSAFMTQTPPLGANVRLSGE